MFLRKMGQARKYREEEKGDGGDGGGSVKVEDLLANPEVQKAIQEKLDKEVAGLKKKNSDLIAKEKALKETMAQFDGIDIEKVKNLQKQMLENEEMRLLAEGKTEEVVARRVELLKKDYESQLSARDNKLKEYEDTIKNKEEKLRGLLVDGTIREAYASLDYEPAAMDDVIRSAREVFIMGEDGKVVPRDSNGNMIFGKDGKSAVDARGWLELQAEKKPYLRRPSKGGGAGANSKVSTINKLSSTGKIAEGLRKLGM